jgi:hypothetical protein
MTAIPTTLNQATRTLKLDFAAGNTYTLQTACRPELVSSVRQIYDFSSRHVLTKVTDRIWQPFWTEAFITAAMIPLTVVSGGVAGMASKPVQVALVRLGTRIATQQALNAAARIALIHVIPRVAAALTGAIVFSAIHRTSLAAISLGRVPIYDFKKTLWQNYGKDLIFGTAIFMFLPVSAAVAHRLSANLIRAGGLSHASLQRLATLGIEASADTVVFTSAPYVERTLAKLLGRSTDPIVRGWRDFTQNVEHSAMISLAFRVRGAGLTPAP